MLVAWVISMALAVPQATKAAGLPDTPQGKHVLAFITAFNTGDEKTFLAAQEQHMATTTLDKRPAADRAQMFKRMQGDFGSFTVRKVVKATAQQIQIIIPTKDGEEATFTFDFEAAAPYKIAGLGVDIKGDL